MMMKLVRFDDWRTGLVVQLPTGPHLIDVVASVGVLLPEDPVSNGVLNGILKDRGSWAPLIEHWGRARVGLTKLAQLALRSPDHPRLIMRPFDGTLIAPPSNNLQSIAALEIIEQRRSVHPGGCESVARPIEERAIRDLFADERVVALDAYRK